MIETVAPGVTVQQLPYRGWAGSLRIANEVVEAIVVPAIGRVMQFRWVHKGQSVLWENTNVDAHRSSPDVEGWINFGGDKVWPSPQAEWKQVTGRSWPPPQAFDALPYSVAVSGTSILVTSSVDPHYGIACGRRITLSPSLPRMTISTTFHKVAGSPVRTGIWGITQMPYAERIYALISEHPAFPGGVARQTGGANSSMKVEGRLFSLAPDPGSSMKIGLDAHSLLWIGARDILRIDAAEANGEFPDGGCRAEIYSNPAPLPYVELEMLSPLTTLKERDAAAWVNTYTLLQRSLPSPLAEATKAFDLG